MFPLKFFLNIFYVGGIYSLIYAIILAMKTPEVAEEFSERMKKDSTRMTVVSVMASAIGFYLLGSLPAMIILVSVFAMFVAWHFGKSVEEKAFTRKVRASEIKEGDVLASSKKWIGLTREEAEKIRSKGGWVEIKEGVRFGPVFFLALVFTISTGKAFGII